MVSSYSDLCMSVAMLIHISVTIYKACYHVVFLQQHPTSSHKTPGITKRRNLKQVKNKKYTYVKWIWRFLMKQGGADADLNINIYIACYHVVVFLQQHPTSSHINDYYAVSNESEEAV